MELRQLSYFVAVAEELHFGRAAAKVRIAQPALSNHVQALERELGCQLFLRSTRRVELTRAGETFYARCVGTLSEVDLSAEITRPVAGKTIRQIKIGTVYPATTGVLPAFLSKNARKYPDIRIHIASGNTDDIIRSLESGQINLGFIRPVENIGSLRFFSIAHERYLLAVARTNRLAGQAEITIDDLRSEKIISFNRQNLSYTERYFNEKFDEYDLTRNIAYSCDVTYSLVSAGLGIGFAPEWTEGLPNPAFELKAVRGIDFRIGLGLLGTGKIQPPRGHRRYCTVAGTAGEMRGKGSCAFRQQRHLAQGGLKEKGESTGCFSTNPEIEKNFPHQPRRSQFRYRGHIMKELAMQGEASALLETLVFTLGVITNSNAEGRRRIAEVYYEAQRMVATIELESGSARHRIVACLERFNAYKAEDDVAAAGWMLTALQERIGERDLTDWEKLKIVAEQTVQLLLALRNELH